MHAMIAKTNAQRQAELKERRQAAGLVPVTNLWAHPDDVQPIMEHAAKLVRKRAKSQAAAQSR
jgi:hypothetical protein